MNDAEIRALLRQQRDGLKQTSGTVAIQRHNIAEADWIEVQRWIHSHGGERQSDVTDSTAPGGGPSVVSDSWMIPESELLD